MTDLIGYYHGHVISPKSFKIFNLIWKGKLFQNNNTVLNNIFGYYIFKGNVIGLNDKVVITYPTLGLTDVLCYDSNKWNGTLELFGLTVQFELRK